MRSKGASARVAGRGMRSAALCSHAPPPPLVCEPLLCEARGRRVGKRDEVCVEGHGGEGGVGGERPQACDARE
eukprot:2562281-Rhodomonas_salina.1